MFSLTPKISHSSLLNLIVHCLQTEYRKAVKIQHRNQSEFGIWGNNLAIGKSQSPMFIFSLFLSFLTTLILVSIKKECVPIHLLVSKWMNQSFISQFIWILYLAACVRKYRHMQWSRSVKTLAYQEVSTPANKEIIALTLRGNVAESSKISRLRPKIKM